jgi:RHS repeat-associated protein
LRSKAENIKDYVGSIVYENGELSYIQMPEGRFVHTQAGDFAPEYYLKDHLGNTRSIISASGKILEQDAYYPFGMPIESLSYTSTEPQNQYLYNGKELQPSYGLDWLEYGARMYDPTTARFWIQDRFAEKYIDKTPYQYAANNPILYIDVNGDSLTEAAKEWVIKLLNIVKIKLLKIQNCPRGLRKDIIKVK